MVPFHRNQFWSKLIDNTGVEFTVSLFNLTDRGLTAAMLGNTDHTSNFQADEREILVHAALDFFQSCLT